MAALSEYFDRQVSDRLYGDRETLITANKVSPTLTRTPAHRADVVVIGGSYPVNQST